ncbi:MAG: hypothetical protein FWG27_01540 [Treponema sp.]|nr:hypothetical protein [Treponema sp.]
MKKYLLLTFLFCVLADSYAQDAYRNYKWGMTVAEVAQNSSRLLPVNNVTRFSDVIFDIIAYSKNYIVDGRIIRPVVFSSARNERQLYDENIAFYFENNKLTAISIYHMDLNSPAISRDDIVIRYGEPRKYQWKTENKDEDNILELFAGDANRYIVLQSITQGSGAAKKLILKHLIFVDKKWIDEKLKKFFDDYNNAKVNEANRLLN